jgi:hypothetical protein
MQLCMRLVQFSFFFLQHTMNPYWAKHGVLELPISHGFMVDVGRKIHQNSTMPCAGIYKTNNIVFPSLHVSISNHLSCFNIES